MSDSSSSSSVSSSSEDSPVVAAAPPPSRTAGSAAKKIEKTIKTNPFGSLEAVRSGSLELMLLKVPAGFDPHILNGVKARVAGPRELVALPDVDVSLFGMEKDMFDRVTLIARGEDGFESKGLEFASAVSVVTTVKEPDAAKRSRAAQEALAAIAPKPRKKHRPLDAAMKLPVGARAPVTRQRADEEAKVEDRKQSKKEKKPKKAKQSGHKKK